MAVTVQRPDVSLEDKYAADEGRVFLTGVQALVRVILDQLRADADAGLDTAVFASGYQGSPLGTLDRELARRAGAGLVHVPGLNEELAATSVWGTQLAHTLPGPRRDGVLGVWYGKAPGLDRASDAIRHGNLVGTTRTGGCVAYVGDDPSCKSSSLPSASEGTLAALRVPTLYPGNLQDVLDLGRHAVAVSRAAGTWAALKIVTSVADGAGTAEVGHDRVRPVVPELDDRGAPYRHEPSGHLLAPPALDFERTLFEVRLPLAKLYARLNGLNPVTLPTRDARIGLVAAGRAYYDLRQAIADLGLDDAALERAGVRILKVGMLYPLDELAVREFAAGLEEILVIEDKGPLLESAVRDALYGRTPAPRVLGRADADGRPLLPAGGELDGDAIARALGRVLEGRIELPALGERLAVLDAAATASGPLLAGAARSPFFCSGCPHNRSTDVPAGTQVGVGIGCHTMVLLTREDKGHLVGMTQMGAEGAQWIGMAPFTDTRHFVQNMGDGTYHHSGSLSIRAAVAAGSDITFKLLYNDAVAMTGGQAVQGVLSVPDLTRSLALEGVRRIVITTDDPGRYRGVAIDPIATVRDRADLPAVHAELAAVPGVTVLIHDQQCAAEKRRLRKRGKLAEPATAVHINERVCEGCGDCGKASDCLSVQPVDTEFGRKTRIHQASCNKDYSCLEGDCPSFLTVIPATGARRRAPAAPPAPPQLPAPAVRALDGDFTIRIPGIGGTGVVTLSQVLGMAAMLDGHHVWSLDQTGLSQKGGPVVSDVRISRRPIAAANKATAATVDVLLGLDVLGATARANLAVADPARTVAVVSGSEVPTGHMVIDPERRFPPRGDLAAAIAARTRAPENVWLDALALAEAVFGDSMPANTIALGAAVQAGLLPVTLASLEQAFRINGAAVSTNLRALAWGRAAVAAPDAVRAAIAAAGPPAPPAPTAPALVEGLEGRVREVVERRAADLVAYADRRYAQRYVDRVRDVLAAERAATPGRTAITEAFAGGLYKLMAYKDEYEVARLHLDAAERARVTAQFGAGAKVYWHLHPPVLRALGMRRKLRLGRWFTPALLGLRAMRRLRGTALDPFGRAEVRRVERALVGDYAEAVGRALEHLRPETHADVVAVCELPDVVRGYEAIKLANVARYRERRAELLGALEALTGASARSPRSAGTAAPVG